MSLSLPPNYLPLPIESIRDAYRPDKRHGELFLTLVSLLCLAWQNKYEGTPRIREDELYNTTNPNGSEKKGYLDLSRRQYFTQKREMQLLGWLRSSHPAPGFVQFTFSRSIVEKVAVSREASAENRTDGAENRTVDSVIVGGESLTPDLKPDSLTPLKSTPSAENRTSQFPSVAEILAQTPLLFDGAVVISKGLDDRDPLNVLAWCTYAYSQKSKLNGPGGVVRNRLLENEPPPAWTKHRWRSVLPEDFLEALGLIEYECEVCQQQFPKRAELTEHAKEHPLFAICGYCSQKFVDLDALDQHLEEEHTAKELVSDESVLAPIHGSLNAEQAWQSVLGQLQMEMPRASFDTWVCDTKAWRYDGNGTIEIATRNDFARDWLENRLTSTVNRLLVGIMNRTVSVKFVVTGDHS